jgi:hypothetical protein
MSFSSSAWLWAQMRFALAQCPIALMQAQAGKTIAAEPSVQLARTLRKFLNSCGKEMLWLPKPQARLL